MEEHSSREIAEQLHMRAAVLMCLCRPVITVRMIVFGVHMRGMYKAHTIKKDYDVFFSWTNHTHTHTYVEKQEKQIARLRKKKNRARHTYASAQFIKTEEIKRNKYKYTKHTHNKKKTKQSKFAKREWRLGVCVYAWWNGAERIHKNYYYTRCCWCCCSKHCDAMSRTKNVKFSRIKLLCICERARERFTYVCVCVSIHSLRRRANIHRKKI